MCYHLRMGLNRVQKRNLAIVLVSQASQVVDEWDSFQQKEFPGVPEGALADLSEDDVRQRFAGWLQYLPGKPAASMLLGEEEGGEDSDDNSSVTSNEYVDAVEDIVEEVEEEIEEENTPW